MVLTSGSSLILMRPFEFSGSSHERKDLGWYHRQCKSSDAPVRVGVSLPLAQRPGWNRQTSKLECLYAIFVGSPYNQLQNLK